MVGGDNVRSTLYLAMIALLLAPACASTADAPAREPAPAAAGTPLIQPDETFAEFDVPPIVDRMVEPDYPEYARRNQVEGRVVLQVTVTEKGKVADAQVVESSDRMFNEAALNAVRQWHFKPARKDGVKVRSRAVVPIVFRF
jgi:protein TonB